MIDHNPGDKGTGGQGDKDAKRFLHQTRRRFIRSSPPLPLSLSLSLLAFALPLTVYLFTLPPGITWANQGADGGDLITAAVTLGVPHPSGYPTYTLLGRLFSALPLGSIAWRFNLLSAVSVAGAAWLLFKIVRVAPPPQPLPHINAGEGLFPPLPPEGWGRVGEGAALAAAWSFAFVPLVWSQAIIAEVYGLNLFFVALLLWLALQIKQGKTKITFWLGLTFGLSLGVHLTNLFLLPLLGWTLYKRQTTKIHPSSFILHPSSFILHPSSFILAFILGLLIFAYLPLRAGRAPITWGTPDTLGGFWGLVSGQIYQAYLFAAPPQSLGPRGLALLQYLTGAGVFALALAGFGLHWLWPRRRALIAWSLLSAAGYIIYAAGYNTVDSFVYLLPVILIMHIYVGLGARNILGLASSRRGQMILGGFLLAIPLAQGLWNMPQLSLRYDTAAENFYQSVLAQAPPNAVLLTADDGHTFALWYAKYALNHRPDVAVVDTRLAVFPWHQADLLRQWPDLTQITELPTILRQRASYHRPLCSVMGQSQNLGQIGENGGNPPEFPLSRLSEFAGENETTWKVECLE